MNEAMVAAASAMTALERNFETTAHNLANVDRPGYQWRHATSRSFTNALDAAQNSKFGDIVTEERIAFAPGSLAPSSNPTAIALRGNGFFEVKGPDGPLYTRNGDFIAGADGRLETRSGYPVMGTTGELRLPPGGGKIRVDDQGTVFQGQGAVGQMKIVDFTDKSKLVPASDTLFSAPSGASPTTIANPELTAGMVEKPSEGVMGGLIAMVTTQRQYESAQKSLSAISDSYERLSRIQN